MTTDRNRSAAAFRALHAGPGVLLLANAWDAGSARVIADAGARAVATTSAGVAWAHGYRDGDALPLEALVATVAEIVRAIDVPLTVDVEGGYANDPDRVARNVLAVLGRGAVGINLEDGAGSPALLAAKIRAVKAAAAAHGHDVYVNARTDVYLRALAAGEAAVSETLARAATYREAGADGLFVPGLTEPRAIEAVAHAARMPLNLMARPALPKAAELAALGVRRLSAGAGIAEQVLAETRALAAAFHADGDSVPVSRAAATYGALNALFR